MHPDGATLTPPAFYILGFNGGERAGNDLGAGDTPSRSARRWFKLCGLAAQAIGADTWGITERCHWGSPDIPTLITRLAGTAELRRLLKLHAAANLAMFKETPPLVVWVTGLGYLRETVEDYGLTVLGEPVARQWPLKGILWLEYVGEGGVPYLFSRHPTGARFAKGEHDELFLKLKELAAARQAGGLRSPARWKV